MSDLYFNSATSSVSLRLVRRQQYNIFVLCLKKKDGDESLCKKEKLNAYGNCPGSWV